MPKPRDEQAEMLHAGMPMPAGASAPAQEQRDPAGIGPRRQLRPVAAEPDMPQERVRVLDNRQLVIEHRPVPHARRQGDWNARIVIPSRGGHLYDYQPPVAVVVRLVFGQDGSELSFMEDQQPVQALAAHGADPPFGVGVRPRRPRWTAQDLDPDAGEDGVEAGGELGVSVADQEPEGSARSPSSMRRLRACWVTHSPVGCRVTPRTWTRRVPTSITKNT